MRMMSFRSFLAISRSSGTDRFGASTDTGHLKKELVTLKSRSPQTTGWPQLGGRPKDGHRKAANVGPRPTATSADSPDPCPALLASPHRRKAALCYRAG